MAEVGGVTEHPRCGDNSLWPSRPERACIRHAGHLGECEAPDGKWWVSPKKALDERVRLLAEMTRALPIVEVCESLVAQFDAGGASPWEVVQGVREALAEPSPGEDRGLMVTGEAVDEDCEGADPEADEIERLRFELANTKRYIDEHGRCPMGNRYCSGLDVW